MPFTETETDCYIDTEKEGYTKLVLTSEEPKWSPIVKSENGVSGSIDFSEFLDYATIRIGCATTDPIVFDINDTGFPITVTPNESMILKPRSRIKTITIQSGSAFYEIWKDEPLVG